jgi:hypothetical protein
MPPVLPHVSLLAMASFEYVHWTHSLHTKRLTLNVSTGRCHHQASATYTHKTHRNTMSKPIKKKHEQGSVVVPEVIGI